MTAEIDQIPHFDITAGQDTLEEDMYRIYRQLFGDQASRDRVSIEELSGGYVNAIWKLSLKKDDSKSLVFRTFGMKFDEKAMAKKMAELSVDENSNNEKRKNSNSFLVFSRLSEHKVMQVVSHHGLCQPVYATYNNGIAYGFTRGSTVTGELMLTEDFLNEAATKLARFHSIKYEIPDLPFKTYQDRMEQQFGPSFQAMLKKADKKLDLEGRPFPYSEIPRIEVQIELEAKIKSLLEKGGPGRIVFSHNDCNQKNLVWEPQSRRLGFIDLELVMANNEEYDLGYLFALFPGHFLCKYEKNLFPNEAYRRRFLRVYLQEYYRLNGLDTETGEFETELEDLFHRANLISILQLIRWTGLALSFDFNKDMFQNQELDEERKNDQYFCGTFSLKMYRFFQELYEPFMEEAEKHFAKRKRAYS